MVERSGTKVAWRRLVRQRPGWGLWTGALILQPPVRAVASREWRDVERIPETGGCIVVFNHISHLDPLVTADLLWTRGRLPRYLAKQALFRNRFLGALLRNAGQIPVERLTTHAVNAYDAAVQAVNAGECLAVYPEGTLTRDPDLWPMRGKSGAARIALATGAPVIPVGHWGVHEILPPYAKVPHLFPRGHVVLQVGEPVDLSDLMGRETTGPVVQEATDRIMAALTACVEDVRQAEAPAERFDPAAAGVRLIGNPRAGRKRRTRIRTRKGDTR